MRVYIVSQLIRGKGLVSLPMMTGGSGGCALVSHRRFIGIVRGQIDLAFDVWLEVRRLITMKVSLSLSFDYLMTCSSGALSL